MKRLILVLVAAGLFGRSTSGFAQAAPTPGPAVAVTAGGGVGRLWDDETNLGSGAVVSGGMTTTFAERLRVSGSIDWMSHSRSLTYLEADGRLSSGFARLTFLFGASDRRVRPLVGAGLGVVRSTGTLTTPAVIVGPSGQPMLETSPSIKTLWTTTHAAYDVHGGVRVRLGPRLALEPEVRWRTTQGGAADRRTSAIEPPLLNISGLVNLEWRLR